MENLLSLAFDNLSSYDALKIGKGLRQVEGLLAQLCLAPSKPAAAAPPSTQTPTPSPGRSRQQPKPQQPDDSSDSDTPQSAKSLTALSDDPAFREFFKLQEGFEWNVSIRLVGALDRLVARSRDGENNRVILSGLDLMQGLMLLHPPSKSLFSREQNMNLLLDLLEPAHCPEIQSATLLTLVAALIDTPANTRTFEALDGLLTITSLFRSRSTDRDFKLKLVEFLYFYLMPENPTMAATPRSPGSSKRRGSVVDDAGSVNGGGGAPAKTRTTEEKQFILGKHLSNVEDLVRDLATSAPFGGAVY